MRTWSLFVTVVALLLCIGCNREETVKPANAQALLEAWKLIEPSAYKVTLVIEPGAQTLQLPSVPRFNLSGESSVNQYKSSFSYQAPAQPEIIVTSISTTEKAGSTEAMQFEQTYYANLRAVNRFELTDKNQLRFYYPSGVLVYEK